MALKIGTFYNKGSHFEGMLETRKLHDLGNIIIDPYDKSPDSSEPDYIVRTGQFQIGRGWKQITKDGEREYINLILDDPHMEEEIRARLVKQGDQHILLWERMVD